MVTIYTKPNCKPCVEAKFIMKRRGVSFSEEPLSENIGELMEKGFSSAPVLKVGDRYIAAANKGAMMEALEEAGLIS